MVGAPGKRSEDSLLSNRGLGVTNEGFHGWRCLEVGSQNHCVFAQIEGEGLACPSSLGLNHLEGNATEEIFQGPSDAQTVALDVGEIKILGKCREPGQELAATERVERSISVFPGKEVVGGVTRVDAEVVLECEERVCWTFLFCTLDGLSLAGGS